MSDLSSQEAKGANLRDEKKSRLDKIILTADRDSQTNSSEPLRALLPFLLKYPYRLGFTALFLLVAAFAALAIPYFAGGIIDEGFVTQNLEVVNSYSIGIIAVAGVLAVASAARFYFISVIGMRVITDIRRAVFDHLMNMDVVFFDTNRTGELISRITSDVGIVRGALDSALPVVLRSVVMLTGAVIMMFVTSIYLATAVVLIIPVLVFPVVWLGKYIRGLSRKQQDKIADLAALATETFGAIKTIKAFTREGQRNKEYGEYAEASYQSEVSRLLVRAGMIAFVIFLTASGIVGLIWLGTQLVSSGQITVGELSQFLIYAMMATGTLTGISEILGTLQTVAGATERITEILGTEPSIDAAKNPVDLPTPSPATVAFDNVHFQYLTRDDESVLNGVSFDVKSGETIALVGPSGAGKSTVFSLLQRFYDVSSGGIRVDGVDVREVDFTALRQRFAYVEQDAIMFSGTIADNIRFGKPEATDEEVREAAKVALVDEFVQRLEHGYEAIVGERGVMLSGGQKQRVAIARALLKDAPILLLDEATSALDAQSETKVQQALERLMVGRTTLVVAHRLATIKNADRILVLEDGKIIDQGTHDQLVTKGGRYAELAKLQFQQ
ncbi:ABC transporter transmembrane domain-containing protein [Maritalea sp.]|jgi:ATP-binding cassette subfamily B protein|uniref:ABC transporter transmembrane domain-containing protein n=1 Tax=Maritalea sp. TaxID=2003361 RepID=UPI0039E6CBCE